jgi:hypothetical protein
VTVCMALEDTKYLCIPVYLELATIILRFLFSTTTNSIDAYLTYFVIQDKIYFDMTKSK